MSYDPNEPRKDPEPEASGPWRPPRIQRGPVNPPETYRKANAKVKVRDVHPSRWTRTDVWRRMPVGSIVVAKPRSSTPIGFRWVGRTLCPGCHEWVDQVIRQLTTAPHAWQCEGCTDQYTRNLRHALTNDELFRRGR